MNGNSIPPGYDPHDELWTQDTMVFEAVHDGPDQPSGGRSGGLAGLLGGSPATRYAIIGLTATIAVSLVAIVILLVSGHSGWDAAPNAAKGPGPTRVLVTTSARPTTTTAAEQADVTTAPERTTTTTTTSSTTTTTTTTSTTTTTVSPVVGIQMPCEQVGMTATTSDGTVLTCDATGGASPHWLPITRPALGSPCNVGEAGSFAYSSGGSQLVCTRRPGGGSTPSYVWDSPGTLTTGKHEPGQVCNLKKDGIAQSSSGRAVYCLPADNSNSPIGVWKQVY
ncbi:hypothetical protein ABZ412_08285 [Nocardia sp. NPDC005746]|uniref:hypothetical protein n=1 Tax=unclassified Nocardia TaxID=2637762 RepID=UPI0033E7C800